MKYGALLLLAMAMYMTACGPSNSGAEEKAALEKGKAIADASFQTLSARLQQAMQAGGPAYAVEFCSLNALSIVDSLSAAHSARIRRTTDRVRNPLDRLDPDESVIIQTMLAVWEQNNKTMDVRARVDLHGDSIAYYQPIFINSPTCLKCHGVPGTSLDSSAYRKIRTRYPNDQAIGYAIGDLRGMWSIRWAR